MTDNDIYRDISASILAIAEALEKKGLLSNAELREAATERFLTLCPDGKGADAYPLLHMMATVLPSMRDR